MSLLPRKILRKNSSLIFGALLLVPARALEREAPELPDTFRIREDRWEKLTGGNKILLRPFVATKSLDLTLSGKNDSVKWDPNTGPEVGIDVYYKDISGVGFSISTPGGDRENKGKTTSYDFRFATGFRHLFYQLDFQHYKGFYTTLDGDPYIDDSLTLDHFSFRAIYTLRPDRFSLEALRNQNKRQIESGGSWLFGGNFTFTTSSSPYGLVPPFSDESFGDELYLRRVWTLGLIPRAGYGYTWVFWPKWFIGGLVLAGVGPSQTFLNYGSIRKNKNKLQAAIEAEAFLAIGFTGDTFQSSISAEINTITVPGGAAKMERSLNAVTYTAGWRF